MKSLTPLLGLVLATLVVAVRAEETPIAQAAPLAAAPRPMTETEKLLSAARPQFSAPAEARPAAETDPEVVELPKMTVKPRPRPRLGQIEIMGPKAFNEDLARKNLGALDRGLLNKFTLPLFGTSAAARAREEYDIARKREFLSDVMTIARAAEVADPANAKALREAASKP